ncbi:Mur ligase family protein [Secundilactobacillus oryzae]|uniref:Mur ligase family protein n=1 Tax=Secundilactobacillus oryzae TaxID=1202668 RepID=UPI000A48BED5
MSLGIRETIVLLKEHHLLKSVTLAKDTDQAFKAVTYDSRQVTADTLFFCKGNFKPVYLTSARNQGATAYVAEQSYAEGDGLSAIIVTDIQKAMSLVGAAFYDYPQNDLFIVGITGTKGKTTSAYFTRGILQTSTDEKTALFSTIDRFVGSQPDQHFKSNLTTPESLDLFHDMRTAVTNGMTHLVMEVSSQAYKRNRVFGLKFDVGVFLNITPDHVGRNEHPTFADYLHCKEQLLVNAKRCVINAETAHFADVYGAAKATTQPESIYLFSKKRCPGTK